MTRELTLHRLTLDGAYKACRAIAKREAKNFYYAFIALPAPRRNAICAVYAFMRRADDLADDESFSLDERRFHLAAWLSEWRAVCEGGETGDPVFLAVRDATEHFGIHADEFLKAFPGTTDEEAVRSATVYGADLFIGLGTWKWIEAHAKTGESPVYRYHFELAAPPSKFHSGSFAFHSDDIEYVFGSLDTRPGAEWRPEDRTLSEQMMRYWTNFARTGDPNGEGLPLWPRYDKTQQVIHLDRTTTSAPDTTRPQYEFQMSIPDSER